jgi:hypothetical protein
MKLMFSSITANRFFIKANRRQNAACEELERRFERISTSQCKQEMLILSFVDREEDYFHLVHDDPAIFHVEVGYDYEDRYSPEDDVLLIQLIEEKLMLAIDACEALGAAREELNAVVEAWTTENVVLPDA